MIWKSESTNWKVIGQCGDAVGCCQQLPHTEWPSNSQKMEAGGLSSASNSQLFTNTSLCKRKEPGKCKQVYTMETVKLCYKKKIKLINQRERFDLHGALWGVDLSFEKRPVLRAIIYDFREISVEFMGLTGWGQASCGKHLKERPRHFGKYEIYIP